MLQVLSMFKSTPLDNDKWLYFAVRAPFIPPLVVYRSSVLFSLSSWSSDLPLFGKGSFQPMETLCHGRSTDGTCCSCNGFLIDTFIDGTYFRLSKSLIDFSKLTRNVKSSRLIRCTINQEWQKLHRQESSLQENRRIGQIRDEMN